MNTGAPTGTRDAGAATVTALVLMFAFMTGGLIWLAVDVNDRVAARTTAQSIAFQAARSGAQQVGELRGASTGGVRLDADGAREAATATGAALAEAYGVTTAGDGWLVSDVAADGTRIVVKVRLVGGDGRIVTGVGAASPQTAAEAVPVP